MSDTEQRRALLPAAAATAAGGTSALALATELRRLATELEAQSAGTDRPAGAGKDLATYAYKVRAGRRALDRLVGDGWLTDPALDILLGAFAAEAGGAVSADEGTGPSTPATVRRWIGLLQARGLLVAADPDGSPTLTEAGRSVVGRYLDLLRGTPVA